MIALACTALVLAALLLVGWRVERVLREREAKRLAIEERKLALEERKLERTPPSGPVEIPAHLLAIAESETEEWAKEQVKGRMRELYADCGDWETVAHVLTQEMHGSSRGTA